MLMLLAHCYTIRKRPRQQRILFSARSMVGQGIVSPQCASLHVCRGGLRCRLLALSLPAFFVFCSLRVLYSNTTSQQIFEASAKLLLWSCWITIRRTCGRFGNGADPWTHPTKPLLGALLYICTHIVPIRTKSKERKEKSHSTTVTSIYITTGIHVFPKV